MSAASESARAPRLWMPSAGVTIPVATVLLTLLFGLVLIALTGVSVGDAIGAFINGAFGSGYVIAASINRSVVYTLVGLGFIVAARANLTNVGGEGQIAVGGIAATAVALYGGVKGLPLGLAFIVPALAATVAGAAWGALAGVLKVKAGTNEVISTLLLTFIGIWLVYWCVESSALLRRPMTTTATLPESLEIANPTRLPLLSGDPSVPLNIGLPVTVILVIAVWVILARSVFGWQLRAIGLNELASRRAGIPRAALVVAAMAIAGGFGGLAGAVMLQGDQYLLKAGFSSGYGFDGLVIGLLARGSAAGVVAGALLFGFLRSGGINMEMVARVPSAIVMVIQGLIVVTLAAMAFWLDRRKVTR
ncbi:MAG TPA: ABC transporter permease [Stellaceae bacterium]|nr:ABC transporter permease [Stellaceae bacterium]